jgi:predicted RNase H-like nuclease (RuvC/YqgF family)
VRSGKNSLVWHDLHASRANSSDSSLDSKSSARKKMSWRVRSVSKSNRINSVSQNSRQNMRRIHALELEEADLKKQIAQMDEEREHLTQVIDGFKKELEVV